MNLITEEDLKQSALVENASSSKKDKKDERRKKAAGKEVECNYCIWVRDRDIVTSVNIKYKLI